MTMLKIYNILSRLFWVQFQIYLDRNLSSKTRYYIYLDLTQYVHCTVHPISAKIFLFTHLRLENVFMIETSSSSANCVIVVDLKCTQYQPRDLIEKRPSSQDAKRVVSADSDRDRETKMRPEIHYY